MGDLASISSRVIILGDLNINYNEKNTKVVKEIKLLEKEFSIKQHIKSPTRVIKTTATLIDHIYTNLEHVSHAGVVELNISNHNMIYIVVKKAKELRNMVNECCRNAKNEFIKS